MNRWIAAITGSLMLTAHLSAAEPITRLTVQPMAAPQPSMRYALLPELRELNSGNPAQWYVRCFQEQRNFFFGKEAVAERALYRSMPLAELPVDKLRKYGGNAIGQADWGARLDALDWQVTPRVQAEGMDLRLPELAPLRILVPALQVRFRGEIADRRFDDAVRTAKTMFALARHLGEHPTVAGNWDGLIAAEQALDSLAEMIQQPGCPNLYWALADLPTPLVEIRKGLQGHRSQVAVELKPLRDDAAMSDAELERFVAQLTGSIGYLREQAGLPPRNLRSELNARVNDADHVQAARKRLLAAGNFGSLQHGWASLQTMSVPPLQAILLNEKRELDRRCDAETRLVALTPAQIQKMIGDTATDSDGLFADLLPPVLPLRREQARVEQRIASLRIVEAIRMHAAERNGQLPATLADIAVPLPDDPFTGKQFGYELDGATAKLRSAQIANGPMQTEAVEIAVTLRK
jgi:hypothetical protein